MFYVFLNFMLKEWIAYFCRYDLEKTFFWKNVRNNNNNIFFNFLISFTLESFSCGVNCNSEQWSIASIWICKNRSSSLSFSNNSTASSFTTALLSVLLLLVLFLTSLFSSSRSSLCLVSSCCISLSS